MSIKGRTRAVSAIQPSLIPDEFLSIGETEDTRDAAMSVFDLGRLRAEQHAAAEAFDARMSALTASKSDAQKPTPVADAPSVSRRSNTDDEAAAKEWARHVAGVDD